MISRNDPCALWKLDRDHFIHPYTDFATFGQQGSQIILEAEGVHVTDCSNRTLLDGIAGLWCVNIGHGWTEMARAISDQVLQMDYFNPFGHTSNAPASELAGRLAQLAPGTLTHVFYGCGGSEANDLAIRLVHYYFNRLGLPDKKKIISRVDAYHGSTYLTASLTGIESSKIGFDANNALVHYVSAPNLYRMPEGMNASEYCDCLVAEFAECIETLGPENVAAFIAEPIMGAGGVLVAPQGYHRRMQEICRGHDVLYISDEVVTAFGRLGEMMSSESLFEVQPDVLCLAKGLTSGYLPLGATLFSDAFYDVINTPQCENGQLSLGYTYSGHPVSCAAALANIDIIEEEKLCKNVRVLGPLFQEKLSSLSQHEIVGDVRGSHLMAGIELVADRATKIGFDPSVQAASRVAKHCMEMGLVVRPIGNVIVLSPPLIVTEGHCEEMVDILGRSIEAVQSDLEAEGLIPASLRGADPGLVALSGR